MQEGVLAYPALAQSAAQRYISHLKEVEVSVATADSPSMATKFPTDGHDVAGG
jgi:hypothetical protein